MNTRYWYAVALVLSASLCWSCQRFPAEYLFAKPTDLPTANKYPVPQAADQQTGPKYPGAQPNTNGKISGGSDPCLQPGGVPDMQVRAAVMPIADAQVDYLVVSAPQFYGLQLQPKIGTTKFEPFYSRLYIHDHATAVAVLGCLRRATTPCVLPGIEFPTIEVHIKRVRPHSDRVVKITFIQDEGNRFRRIMSAITAR